MTAAEVRAGLFARLRAIGPEYWLLAFFATTVTNLLDFATVPDPGQRPGAGFVVAAVVRVLLVFWAAYALARRIAGVPRPLLPSVAAARFAGFSFAMLVLFGAAAFAWGHGLALRDTPLATQWLAMLALAALWGVAVMPLVGLGPAFAGGAAMREAPAIVRATRRNWLALALGFVQIVLPFAAIHLALTLVGVRLSLGSGAVAALALIDGVVSGIQLVLATALGVVAWRAAGAPLRGDARPG